MIISEPIISVITIVYNDVKNIKATLDSVLNQTYKNIEYIVIDGGSKDGTADVIKSISNQLGYWVSEPDKGIYDAMNKGIAKATGNWIIFMNCGDTFFSPKTVEHVFGNSSFDERDFIYGSSKYYKANGNIFDKHVPYGMDDIWRGPNFRHGALFAPTAIMQEYAFDVSDKNLKVSADFDFIYKSYKRGHKFVEVKETILLFQEDGVSNNYLKCLNDNLYIIKKYGDATPSKRAYYSKLKFKLYTKNFLKKSFLAKPLHFIIQFIYSYFPNYVLNVVPFYSLRHFYYRRILKIKLGQNSSIHLGVQVFGRQISIGSNTTINRKVHLDGRGKLQIGDNVSISQDCFLITADHDYNTATFSYRSGEIQIQDYAWLGTRVTVLPNVVIGQGAVVCAGAVVTKPVEPYTVVAGVPAREIGKRNPNLTYHPVDFTYCD
ncbi:glycosyltransferase [Deminuibacter soli]|uniref:Glycosyltransferase n=1 Tax=Deminuibacter soli TaxID=2291815 RepID=A0A3E1NFL8_9BACT|nr:glycosyltransferase [Deminuibacter soli]RFM26667.1 glycosyltransferase [Deminuibacter soli]